LIRELCAATGYRPWTNRLNCVVIWVQIGCEIYKRQPQKFALFPGLKRRNYGNAYIQQIASKHKPANIFARLLTFETGRLPLETEMFHRSCDVSHWKALSYFWRNCHVLMCLRARFNISKPVILRSSHKKYEYKQVWSLLQYRELGNTETYTKSHQNMKNNWIRSLNYNTSHEQWNIPFPTVNVTFQT
jgi:hypothetical protein